MKRDKNLEEAAAKILRGELSESDEPISYPYVTGLLTAYLEDITTKMAQNDIKVDSDTRNRIDELTAQLVADAKKEAREHYKKHGF